MEQAFSARTAVAVAVLATVMVQLDISIITIAVADLGRTFSVEAADTAWAVNAYTLVFASLLLNAGILFDRIGARRSFVLGFAVFTAASLACGMAPSWPTLLVARALQGIGGALLFPTALAVIRQATPDARTRARSIGLWSAAGSAALAGGPVLGGLLIPLCGWRSIFLVNIPLGIVGLRLASSQLPPEPPATRGGTDLPGQFFAAAMLTCAVVLTQEAGRDGWHSGRVGMLAFGLVVLSAALIRVERTAERPILSRALLRTPGFAMATTIGAALSFAFYGLVFAISLHLQTAEHRGALHAGLALAPMMLSRSRSTRLRVLSTTGWDRTA